MQHWGGWFNVVESSHILITLTLSTLIQPIWELDINHQNTTIIVFIQGIYPWLWKSVKEIENWILKVKLFHRVTPLMPAELLWACICFPVISGMRKREKHFYRASKLAPSHLPSILSQINSPCLPLLQIARNEKQPKLPSCFLKRICQWQFWMQHFLPKEVFD